MYPEKGAIQPGSLADIILVDPHKTVIPKDEEMESKAAWTPYVDWELKGQAPYSQCCGEP